MLSVLLASVSIEQVHLGHLKNPSDFGRMLHRNWCNIQAPYTEHHSDGPLSSALFHRLKVRSNSDASEPPVRCYCIRLSTSISYGIFQSWKRCAELHHGACACHCWLGYWSVSIVERHSVRSSPFSSLRSNCVVFRCVYETLGSVMWRHLLVGYTKNIQSQLLSCSGEDLCLKYQEIIFEDDFVSGILLC